MMQYTELDLKIKTFTQAGGKAEGDIDARGSNPLPVRIICFSLSNHDFHLAANDAVRKVWEKTKNEQGMTFGVKKSFWPSVSAAVCFEEALFNNRYMQKHLAVAVETLTQWQKLAKSYNPKKIATALSGALSVNVETEKLHSHSDAHFLIPTSSFKDLALRNNGESGGKIESAFKAQKIGIETTYTGVNSVGLTFPVHEYKVVLAAVRKAPKGSLSLATILSAPKQG